MKNYIVNVSNSKQDIKEFDGDIEFNLKLNDTVIYENSHGDFVQGIVKDVFLFLRNNSTVYLLEQ